MGAARFFGQPITPYCKQVEKALALFETDKPKKFYPSWGKDRAQEILMQCKKQ